MKKVFSMLLSLIMVIQSISMVSANSLDHTDEIIIAMTQSEIEKAEQEAINAYLNSLNRTRVNDYEYKSELDDSEIDTNVKIGYAGGQPANGTEFASPGGFYWADGGAKVTVNIGVSFKSLSASISVGNVGSSGKYISSPYVNTPCKLLIHKDIKVNKYKVYRRKIMPTTGAWEYVEDTYTYTPVKDRLSVVKV